MYGCQDRGNERIQLGFGGAEGATDVAGSGTEEA